MHRAPEGATSPRPEGHRLAPLQRQKVTALESLRTERDLWPSTYAAHRVEIDAKVDRLRVEIEECIGDLEAMHAGPVVVDTD